MITDKDVVPALASVGFNRYTTFGWVLPRPDLGGWQDSGSFSTHANVKPVTVPASIPTMYRPHII
ncbi:hypothetical protein B7R74_12505 [Yersinia pseudotuberculosis]|uniref:hypothetical protein n=1 Tax=Yersinia pseudotuberculosis TaxID=633 RepID=UPI0005DDC14E|nr:hypothetical protein [Yersinia pseudotuberculosis]PSH19831.1 hypothetical protein B7R74_12505 [Yersinia pseudotuberculosis]CND56145.1 phage protein [Yersinia pseudotuberculosis]CQH39302.1 phage protein [Yersinia pseudotuberculosis]